MTVFCLACKNSTEEGKQSSQITKVVEIDGEEKEEPEISQLNRTLESKYSNVLEPITNLKTSHEDVYWFIVSWMGTNYRTPIWEGYNTTDWVVKTKERGIDCSGFARVMLKEMFGKQVRGGSQGILEHYCIPISKSQLEMGDLVFFRAPYSQNDRIVHVGVYLKDGYFVHATSTRSAAEGLGLNINSLDETNWSNEYVSGGKVKN